MTEWMRNIRVSILVLISIYLSLRCVAGETDIFVFKTNIDKDELEEELRVFNFRYRSKITPQVYSFKYEGSLTESKIERVLSEVWRLYGDKIDEIERAKERVNWIRADRLEVMPVADSGLDLENSHSEAIFGMNVTAAWSHRHCGKGINIAVTDVGINTNIVDLKKNLNLPLAFNFMKNTTDVTPEFFHNYRTDSMRFVDHGNRCASVIAAVKGNQICSAGIAYEAKIVPLKIFSVQHEHHVFKLDTSSDIMGTALAHGLQHIHIYSNSWAPTVLFEPLDLPTREAIIHGATEGRNKLGAIYVVPDGSDGISGSGIANSIYTIAVNNVGVNGTLPRNSQVSACVLTSALGEGSTLHTRKMYTSSYNNTCTSSFNGVSAAVAEVSAIIALGLEARPGLSIRDVQHLLVHSSSRHHLKESNKFSSNSAGRYFHPFFGFGLIDAERMMSLSKTWQNVGQLYNRSLQTLDSVTYPEQKNYLTRPHISQRMTVLAFDFKDENCDTQLNTIEHVVLQLSYNIINQINVLLEVVSPKDTASLLVDTSQVSSFSKVADFSKDETLTRDLTSVHFWDESPFGRWKVLIRHSHHLATEDLELTSLTIYGTVNISKIKRIQSSCVSTKSVKPFYVTVTEKRLPDKFHTRNHVTNPPGKASNKEGTPSAAARITLYFDALILLAAFCNVV